VSDVSSAPEKGHASLGPSSSHRWIPCPGSIRLSRGVPNRGNEHSRAGTAAHHIADQCLKTGVDAASFEGQEIEVTDEGVGYLIDVDEDMVENVQVYVDYCRTLMAEANHIWLEQEITLESLNPPERMTGTADFAAYVRRTKTLHVVDFKFGRGVVVEAKKNPQLRYYGLGAALAVGAGLEIEHVQLTIVQPRARHPEGVVRHDNLGYLDLLDFADEIIAAAKRTQDPDAPLHAGSHCKFCPAAGFCPEQREMVQALAQVVFETDGPAVVAPPDPAKMSVQQLANVLDNIDVLEDFVKAAKSHGQRLLEEGTVSPEALGQKLVAKRANRRWGDEEKAEMWLRGRGLKMDEFTTQKLKSPKQIELLLGKGKKDLPAELIVKPDVGHTMVPLSDKREAIAIAPQDVFPALPPGDE
jgi:hypothetical protein